jgi:hypothetical protein
MKPSNPKNSSRTKSAKTAKATASPPPAIQLNRANLSETTIVLRLMAHLKRVERGQAVSNLDRICRSLVERAASGDIKAVERIIELIRLLKTNPVKPIEITPDMPLEKASRLYLESIKRTKPDDEYSSE